MAKKKRTRRTAEQRIKDLEARIAEIKARAARQKVAKDPTFTHVAASVRAIDRALGSTEDAATRKALDEARATLSACLMLNGGGNGVHLTRPRRARKQVDPEKVLAYLRTGPESGGEQVAEALGVDTASLRPVMKKLIEARRVKRKGKARGTRYSVA